MKKVSKMGSKWSKPNNDCKQQKSAPKTGGAKCKAKGKPAAKHSNKKYY